ncbi:MBOAT family O-acyltransferase [Legionella massiliensis]|uniref:MBOAT family O-acyltransferase n=1 Tax=Legionella massiliensis TaxID=1034943 RepID=UPI001FDF3046|nr:MBOAT family O-acyltransferase [Legionella massiliensis]
MPNKNISAKNAVALAGSVIFFAWGEPIFVFALLIGTYFDYQISLRLAPEKPTKQSYKKLLLILAITLNTLILILSKYLNFICAEVLPLMKPWLATEVASPNLPLILGISFITFHKISYLVDSYKGRAVPPRHFFDCALYIFLFPQLIAGPIIRYHDIGSQIHARTHSIDGFISGFFRFTIGLIKKLLLADPLGLVADKVFGFAPDGLTSLYAWGGIIAYTLQIYFDFSGYSDMAIGLARMIGFRFPENFNRPYTAQSVTDFWQRWHISLSNWMKLYLYIPLGGNRVSIPRTYMNLWIVFLISGFWHGASWNFIVWGAYYGFFLCLERILATSTFFKRITLPGYFHQLLTLLIITIGWVFFRSPTLSYAIDYLLVMFGLKGLASGQVIPWGMIFSNHAITTIFIGIMLATLSTPKLRGLKGLNFSSGWNKAAELEVGGAVSLQFIISFFLLVLAASAIVSSDYVPFLYFRF